MHSRAVLRPDVGPDAPLRRDLAKDGFEPSITFDADQRAFKICFVTNESNGPVAACALRYHPLAIASSHGTGCGTGLITASRNPNAGDEFFAAQLTSAPVTAPAALLISRASFDYNLAALGMTGCVLG